MLYAKLSLHRELTACRDERRKTKWEQKHNVVLAARNRKLFFGSQARSPQVTLYCSLSKDILPREFYFRKIEKEQQWRCYKGIFGMFLAPFFFLLTLCLGRLTTTLKQLKFCCSKSICMIQCSVSTNGSLLQSMLLLINPNTRLLLMITAAAGKNVCNFNIFAALLHSVLHFSCGSLSMTFQTEFLP